MAKKKNDELTDVVKLRGCMEIGMYDAANGEMVDYRKIDNLVVTKGRAWVLMRIAGSSTDTNVINYMAIGSSTVAANATDVCLGDTSGFTSNVQSIATWSFANTTSSTPNWNAQMSWNTNQANGTWAEAGLFVTNVTASNSTQAQTMLSHVIFTTLPKTNTNTLAVTYTISN